MLLGEMFSARVDAFDVNFGDSATVVSHCRATASDRS
jgi:hypothetical protein